MFILDTKNFASLTLKLSLNEYVKHETVPTRTALSLLNRSFNKRVFMTRVKELILTQQIALEDISRLFMKVNSVYKQASIERSSIRKKSA